MQSLYSITGVHDPREVKFEVEPAIPDLQSRAILPHAFDSVIGRRIAKEIAKNGADKPDVWHRFTSKDVVRGLLSESTNEIRQEFVRTLARFVKAPSPIMMEIAQQPDRSTQPVLRAILERESTVAGLLTQLNEKSRPEELMRLLQTPTRVEEINHPINAFLMVDHPNGNAALAVLSPIGVVHLFRQYFFEFDDFLGPPVQHIWLSPGGTVEMVEVSTRKQIIERTFEQTFEDIEKSDSSTMLQDELSDAVKSENQSNTKLGVSLNTSTSFGVDKIFTSQVNTGTSFDLDQGQKDAREQTHKGLRQQTQKISSEVRKSFKSTFRTVTETTDVDSKRYVIQNTTQRLANYELRRKMRQVGVQVQDYGTQLSWQTYVDDPGADLGVARLVHIAEPADLSRVIDPKEVPPPEPVLAGPTIPKTGHWDWADHDSSPHNFVPLFGDIDVAMRIPKWGYKFKEATIVKVDGPAWTYAWRTGGSVGAGFNWIENPAATVQIDTGDGQKEPSIQWISIGVEAGPGIGDPTRPNITLQVTLQYVPTRALCLKIENENKEAQRKASEEEARAYKEALFKAAQERIKIASKVEQRKSEDLREEERVIIYRKLIQQLLAASGLTQADPQLRHIFAELVQMMFDVDRMLYFVAPEWWVPRERPELPSTIFGAKVTFTGESSPQDIGVGGQEVEFNQSTTSWGGTKAERPDNYYITEDSAPARLGSSLGWLIQLDGDDRRNAFLNAPWVKAVVPIRPGREWEALDWLSSPNIEGGDGLESTYQASTPELQRVFDTLKGQNWSGFPELEMRYGNPSFEISHIKIRDAINYLIIRIQANQAAALTKISDPAEPGLSYLPTDMVYEHGFDPLQGGFQAQSEKPFQVFDQWIEVLPTDQIVPVEVTYNPETGRMIPGPQPEPE
jgi:hypothetical protein